LSCRSYPELSPMPDKVVIINVEDNEPNRYARHRILVDAGFITHDASTGYGALELVERHHPDLVLLDINLPDISGIDVCSRLKSSPEGTSILVLQISASATSAPHATAALNNGADGYLAEPVDANVLIATINALLRLRKAERQLQEANQALHSANANLAKANRDLRQSNQDLQQFAYFASHDLQEPLRQVTSFVQFIAQSAQSRLNEEEQKCLNFVVDGAQRMEQLIQALLSYAQLGHNEKIAHSEVDLDSVVDQVIVGMQDRLVESGGTIRKTPLPRVMGDPVQLGDVFQNLIGNSIKYRRPEMPLDVQISATSRSPGEVTVRVTDNGQGIKSDYHELIFLPFRRLHGREIPGTGIGLAICKRIVEAHGGKISIESEPAEGTTLDVSLLLAKQPLD
jgi:two-component system sensor histidine kinase/response regulator